MRYDQISKLGDLRLYGGFHLKHTPCDVFQDNCLLSELMFDNPPWIRGMRKNYQRWVAQTGQANPVFLPEKHGEETDWLRLQQEITRGQGSLESIWHGFKTVQTNIVKPWIIAAPRTEVLEYWYDITLEEWLEIVITEVLRQGYDYILRTKGKRTSRKQPESRIIHSVGEYAGVITAHSVSSIDSILGGRPAVIWGQDPSCGTATPWKEFCAGHIRTPTDAEVYRASWSWASTSYNRLHLEKIEMQMKKQIQSAKKG